MIFEKNCIRERQQEIAKLRVSSIELLLISQALHVRYLAMAIKNLTLFTSIRGQTVRQNNVIHNIYVDVKPEFAKKGNFIVIVIGTVTSLGLL